MNTNAKNAAAGRLIETIEFRMSSDPKLLKIIRASVAHLCELIGFTPEQRNQTTLAVDEACANIIKYAYEGKTDQPIEITARLLEDGLEVILRDYGKKADHTQIKSRDLEDVRPGGLGVHLIQSTMDFVSYDPSIIEGNQLTLAKYRRVNAQDRNA
ncbi:ATP-binding protein [candidate division KSB1 bacterium]|nr:ATP-binding protein [candidate division KSB1 bacterium]